MFYIVPKLICDLCTTAVHHPFPRNQIVYLKELGTGWFGKVGLCCSCWFLLRFKKKIQEGGREFFVFFIFVDFFIFFWVGG